MPARTDLALVLLITAFAGTVQGAEPRWPTPKEIEDARSSRSLPGDAELARQPLPRLPNLEPHAPGIDIESIARRYTQNSPAFTSAGDEQPALKIFVTLAMPPASLKLLADQAERSGATLVLRGLKEGSLNRTLAAVKNIIGERPVAWQIDPPAFARFNVRRVPTFVLVSGLATANSDSSCTGTCDAALTFVTVAGDVSLAYALDYMGRNTPAFADAAKPYLQRLGKEQR